MIDAAPPPPTERDPVSVLRAFWANTLDRPVSATTADTDLFANGADSMDALYLQTRVEAWFAVTLPDHAVIEAPTPAEMAELLQESRTRPAPTRIREGVLTRFPGGDPGVPPLFLAVPGSLPAAAWLARHVDGPRGIAHVGFRRFPGGGPADFDAWFAARCEDGILSILAVDPHGPWRLMAVCGHAIYFWEIARRLSLRGSVSLLLFDPFFDLPPLDDDENDPLPPPTLSPERAPVSRTLQPAGFDLTILLSPNWHHRPSAERFAEFTTGPVTIRCLPSSIRSHGVSASSIASVAAAVRIWLAGQDPAANPR